MDWWGRRWGGELVRRKLFFNFKQEVELRFWQWWGGVVGRRGEIGLEEDLGSGIWGGVCGVSFKLVQVEFLGSSFCGVRWVCSCYQDQILVLGCVLFLEVIIEILQIGFLGFLGVYCRLFLKWMQREVDREGGRFFVQVFQLGVGWGVFFSRVLVFMFMFDREFYLIDGWFM